MDHRTAYIDLDHAKISCTAEGVEVTADADVVVLSGGLDGFERLGREIATWNRDDTDGPIR